MNIGISGATGFIGRHVAAAARADGHRVIAWSRRPVPSPAFDEVRAWQPMESLDASGLDAVIHLAGEPTIGLWTARRKAAIRETRGPGTLAFVRRLREQPTPPRVFVSASGVGWYGEKGDRELTESAEPGEGFLASVSQEWEEAAATAADFARVVMLRIPIVLGPDGGAVPLMRRIFRLGLGGRFGSGRQWMSWIHVQDLARLFLFAVTKNTLRGPVNAVAPTPVTNRDFTAALAAAARRPAILPAPAFVLEHLPGGMGEIFLQSQRALPARATAAGFHWSFPDIQSTARNLFS